MDGHSRIQGSFSIGRVVIRITAILWGYCVVAVLLGPFVAASDARVQLDSSFSLTETYIDNLFFTEDDKEDDFGTFVSPALTLSYESRDVVLRGSYRGTAQFFINHPDANQYAQFSNIQMDFPFLTRRYKRLEVQLTETVNFTPQLQAFSFAPEPDDLATPAQETPEGLEDETARAESARNAQRANRFRRSLGGGRIGGGLGGAAGGLGGTTGGFGGTIGGGTGNQGVLTRRANALQNIAGITLRYAWSPRVSNSASYRNRLLKFTSGDFQDSMTHTGALSWGYRWTRQTHLRSRYSVTSTNFLGESRVGPNGSFVSHAMTIGASHQLARRYSIYGDIGASLTQSRVNLQAGAGITRRHQRGQFSLRYNQFISSGGGLARSAVLSQNLVGTLTQALTRRLNGMLQAGLGRNESLSGDTIDLTTVQGSGGLSMRLLRRLSGSVFYSYIKQYSRGLFGADAQVNQVFLTLTYQFPPWKIAD